MTDARTLNRWRRWGYRWLPGESFSYVLHTRPAECPIMAAHTALGYVLAVGFGVKVWGGEVMPLTLVVRYQRVGSGGPHGYAVDAVGAFLDVIADYFVSR